MSDFELDVAISRFVNAVLPDEVVKQEHAVRGAISDDATVRNDALYPNLPWQRADILIPGSAVAMNGAARVAFPQGAIIRHVAIFAGTAPTAYSFNMSVSADTDSQRFSLQVGVSTLMSGARIEVVSGSWVSIDIIQGGGAENVAITLHYSPLTGGS